MQTTVIHHGATNGVTGSCHQLYTDSNNSLLVDCGLFQGNEAGNSLDIDFETESIKALILTHVHIDHVGRLPWLLATGYQGPIICSRPSSLLLEPVLEDAFKLGVSRDHTHVEKYLKTIRERMIALPYNQWFSLIETADRQLKVRLQRAGHILGSAYIECETTDKHDGSTEVTVFSGDLGAPHTPILPEPQSPERADRLILESTYGDKAHENREQRQQHLAEAIERAQENQGTVLIPAFSIGRTQELLYELETITADQTEPLPVILDSPLATRFTELYKELKPYWDEEAHEHLRRGGKPLSFDNLLVVDNHQQHMQMVQHLNESKRPAIVIAGSGMCNAGRIVNYLKAMLNNPKHAVLFVGYQAQGTPGRDIQQYGPQGGYVWLDDERIDIRARIETISGYSAHADKNDLINFVAGIKQRPLEIRIVHGDNQAKSRLKASLSALYQGRERAPTIEIASHG
ncbi:MBL fold metallo-hydrolase RNA specificity domain-containing protein [Marinobacterium litorale]|uniref:MBL fold metallo-hydrolase RNA specificity domain-containing protein n=1 Tax=Marinobacterium litorale TaxID=404770 RepID=UPI00040813A0|nr:MBL fold metallo-hydrolase [Marinobacterium litorale]